MAKRPTLPLEARIAIEQGRDEIFKTAAIRFNMLFNPILDIASLSAGLSMPDVPRQPMPATLAQQLQQYSTALFDVEAKQHASRTSDAEQLRTWLEDLASDTESELKKIVSKDRLNFHCTVAERSQAVKDGLRNRVTYWVELKAKQRRTPVPDEPITPLTGRHVPIQREADAERTAHILAGHRLQIKAEQLQHIDPPRPIGERLDEIVLGDKSLSHEELADRIGISRTTYFEVKAGRGGRKAKKKTEIYLKLLLSKVSTTKPD